MSDSYLGTRTPGDSGDFLTAMAFVARMMFEQAWTATLVQVQDVHGGGATASPPTVDVVPLVNQLDGFSNPTPHGTIFGLPTARIKAGAAAIVCDPVKGDIGVAVFASHDISTVVASGAQGNPGSRRRFDPSDGLYLMGLIGAAPTSCYLSVDESGVTIGGTNGSLTVAENVSVGNGFSGTFTTATGQTVQVINGIVMNIY